MPLAKIDFVEGRYDEARIAKLSDAIQAAVMNTLRVPPEDFYQLIFELPKNRFHVTFIHGRPKETRLALFKDFNTRVDAAADVSPNDMLITLYEVPGENVSFGRGEAANAVSPAHEKGTRPSIVQSAIALPAVKQIVLASRPKGLPTRGNIRLEEVPMPQLPQGGLLLRVLYLSLDPYMRGQMDDRKSYARPVGVGDVMPSESAGEVIATDQAGHTVGDTVLAPSGLCRSQPDW